MSRAANLRKQKIERIACPNRECGHHGRPEGGNIVPHGFYRVRWGRRRRYRCTACGKTFGATTGTPYKRLQHSMRAFDRVASLSVEGVSKAAIARIEGRSWNTVARWLERAAEYAKRFNDARIKGFVLRELQLDEIRTFLWSKATPIWVFAAIEVWSRLWPATVVGARGYRSTKRIVREVNARGEPFGRALITVDGFKYYPRAIRQCFGGLCVLGQVIKRVRKERVVKVDRRVVIGSEWQLEDALFESEDSNKLEAIS